METSDTSADGDIKVPLDVEASDAVIVSADRGVPNDEKVVACTSISAFIVDHGTNAAGLSGNEDEVAELDGAKGGIVGVVLVGTAGAAVEGNTVLSADGGTAKSFVVLEPVVVASL